MALDDRGKSEIAEHISFGIVQYLRVGRAGAEHGGRYVFVGLKPQCRSYGKGKSEDGDDDFHCSPAARRRRSATPAHSGVSGGGSTAIQSRPSASRRCSV